MIRKLMISALLALTAMAASADKVVEFYFLDAYSLGGSPKTLAEYTATASSDVFKLSGTGWILLLHDGSTQQFVVNEGVKFGATTPGTKPRLYWAGTAYDDTKDIFLSDFRCYAKNKVSVEAPAGYTITKVIMHGKAATAGAANCCDQIKVDAACGGTQNTVSGINTWEADGDGVSKVTYTAATGCNTQAVYRMWVYLKGDDSGIDAIEADDPDAPVEYYDMRGIKIDRDNLPTGMYIMRQGAKTEKILKK